MRPCRCRGGRLVSWEERTCRRSYATTEFDPQRTHISRKRRAAVLIERGCVPLTISVFDLRLELQGFAEFLELVDGDPTEDQAMKLGCDLF